jgi:hypothetical protein
MKKTLFAFLLAIASIEPLAKPIEAYRPSVGSFAMIANR